MATDPMLKVAGLHLSENPYSSMPEGSLVRAKNSVIPFANVLESRRGQKLLSYTFGDSGARANEVYFWRGASLVQYASALALSDGTSFSTISGTYAPPDPDNLRMKFAELGQSLYFTTDAGLYSMTSETATPAKVGLPRPLDLQVSGSILAPTVGTHLTGLPDASGSWFPENSAVGYQIVFGTKDENEVLHLSEPSGRTVVTNPADVVVANGSLIRTGGFVTGTVASHGFVEGDTFALSPADSDGGADIAAGNYTVFSMGVTTITFASVGTGGAITGPTTLSSGSKTVQIDVDIPTELGLTTSHFVRLNRTYTASGASTDPGSEFRTCYERALTAAEIAAERVVISDTCPESFLGAPLYTNPNTGDGTAQANSRPPLATDVCSWDGRLWAFNTTDKHRLLFRLIGTGSPSGLQVNDVLAIGGRAYKFLSGGDITDAYSPAINLAYTASNFVRTFNIRTNFPDITGAFAFMVDDGDSAPGQILIEEFGLGGETIYAATSRQSAFESALALLIPVTEASSSRSGSTVTITTASAHGFAVGQSVVLCSEDDDGDPNFERGLKTVVTVPSSTTFTYTEDGAAATMSGSFVYHVYAATFKSDTNSQPVRYSKPQEDGFPLANYLVGLPKDQDILRAKPLRDKIFVFYKNGDIYTIAGQFPYHVERFDGTASLICADSLVEHSNRLICLTTQGVVSVSDGGVAILSSEIESDLLELIGEAGDEVAQYGFAVSYESDRQYQLWLPSAAGETTCTQAYVWNSLHGQWTRWTGSRTCGRYNPVDRMLYLGDGEHNTLRVERKSYDRTDYCDEDLDVTISSVSGTTATLTSVVGVSVGDMLWQSDAVRALITDVDSGANTLTLSSTESFVAGAATVKVAIDCEAKWGPSFGGQPGFEKIWRDCVFHFNRFYVSNFESFFDCEKDVQEVSVLMAQEGFGLTVFGRSVFGQEVGAKNKRAGIPPQYARSAQIRVGFRIREAWSLWSSNGYTLNYETSSERTGS